MCRVPYTHFTMHFPFVTELGTRPQCPEFGLAPVFHVRDKPILSRVELVIERPVKIPGPDIRTDLETENWIQPPSPPGTAVTVGHKLLSTLNRIRPRWLRVYAHTSRKTQPVCEWQLCSSSYAERIKRVSNTSWKLCTTFIRQQNLRIGVSIKN